MEGKSAWLYKTFVVGVLVLFIGLGVQPAIATIQSEDSDIEYVNITSEFSGLRKKHTVKMTLKEAEELDDFFEAIYEKLNNSGSDVETSRILDDSIKKLGKFDLLGGLSVKLVQRIFTYYDMMNSNTDSHHISGNDNANCFVMGRVTSADFFSPLFLDMLSRYPKAFILTFLIGFGFPFFPIRTDDSIAISSYYEYALQWKETRAKGWIYKNDSEGSQLWHGELKGNLYTRRLPSIGIKLYYIGIEGFLGIKTIFPARFRHTFLGYARIVDIEYW